MGFAIPAALAVKLIYPDRVAMSFIGCPPFTKRSRNPSILTVDGWAAWYVFLRSGALRSKPGGKPSHCRDDCNLHAALHRYPAQISTHPARDLIMVGRRFSDFEKSFRA